MNFFENNHHLVSGAVFCMECISLLIFAGSELHGYGLERVILGIVLKEESV